MPNDNRQEQTAREIRNSEVNPRVNARREIGLKLNQHVAAKEEALRSGDARALLAADSGLLEVTRDVIQTCADLDAALDAYKEKYESEFATEWTQAHASVKPIRLRLAALRAELETLEQQEETELERIAPTVASIEERKRTAEAWANEQRRDTADLIRRLHPQR